MLGGDRFAVDLEDNVAATDTGSVRGRSLYHRMPLAGLGQHERPVVLGRAELPGKLFRERHVANAEEGLAHPAVTLHVFEVLCGLVDGDGEADILGAENDRGVDADCLALQAHERAAGIARVDGRVGLDEAAEVLGVTLEVGDRGDEAREAGDDAGRDRVPEFSQGVPDRDYGLAEADRAGIAERERGEAAGVNLEDGDVVDRIAGKHPGYIALVARREDGVLGVRIHDDVLVRQDDARRIRDEARAAAGPDLPRVGFRQAVDDFILARSEEGVFAVEREALGFKRGEVLADDDRNDGRQRPLDYRNDLFFVGCSQRI